ncbi:unnamed protein product [marine sediment metagenome]|uniref:Uncharacterized protein n=1 Tax=marine sediment metagenome TaxID=412755 RepID=X0UYY2_9ZZZZ
MPMPPLICRDMPTKDSMKQVPGDFMHQMMGRIIDLNKEQVAMCDSDCGQYEEVVMRQHWDHLIEEIGEMAQCRRGKNDEPLSSEAVDAAICALAIAFLCNGGDMKALCLKMDEKLSKWQCNLDLEK